MRLRQSLSAFALITAGIAHPFLDGSMPAPLSRRVGEQEGTIGQYYSADCSGKMADRKDFQGPDGIDANVVDVAIDPKPWLDRGSCTAWYPYLDQKRGPSVGLDFNTDRDDRIKQVQFFKPSDRCAAAEAKDSGSLDVCCHIDGGGLLGVINANGTGSDFGAAKDMGGKGKTCVQLGPGHDQTLWQMRYYISL